MTDEHFDEDRMMRNTPKHLVNPLRLLALPLPLVLALVFTVAACEDEPGNPGPIGPGPEDPTGVLVLNSAGQTIAAFEVDDGVQAAGGSVDLGASFDGVSVEANETFAVSTVSSFGGSRILFVDLEAGDVMPVDFPEPEAEDANPSRATFDAAGSAWVAGRGSDAIYRAAPGASTATRVASDVGTFVEVIRPVGSELAAVDAFIDDDGGTFTPLGPSRVFILDSDGTVVDVVDLPANSFNAIDAVVVDGRLVVLLGGTFDPNTFLPRKDGGLVVVDVTDRSAGRFFALDNNGVAIEAGADGLVYVTTTDDFIQTDLVSFDPAATLFVNGPASPVATLTSGGADLDCWAATALEDGRMLCVTFNVAQEGRLYLLGEDGRAVDVVDSGFGSTDLFVR